MNEKKNPSEITPLRIRRQDALKAEGKVHDEKYSEKN